jgi:hypothetical protein
MREERRAPKFVRWVVMLGIIIALNIFLFVGRSLVLSEPKQQDFCQTSNYNVPPQDARSCVAAGYTWNGTDMPAPPTVSKPPMPTGYCDVYAKCQKKFDAAHEQFALYAFVFGIALGIAAIVISVLPLGSSIVSAGLSYGGVLSLVVASAQYWGDAGNLLRFGISFIALAALIYIGIKRFRD